jgi:two-component system, chemotaxis family, protein-glutamate methylesterase/glutaminase
MINSSRLQRDIIVIGASAGGIEALTKILSQLPSDLSAVIGIVIHRSPIYNLNLAMVLARKATISMKEPDHGEVVKPGTVYLAPRDHHMIFAKDRIELNRGPKEHFTRPSIDPLFSTAAGQYGQRVIGVLLTGGGDDGVSGLIAIKEQHGLVVIQDPQEAKVPTMPLSALMHDHVDLVLPLEKIPLALVKFVKGESIEP